ncbi:MAG: DNA polymerase III subunit alpha [bacterium]
MLSRGETTGVFQMESSGMRRLAKQLRPDVFSDIVALIALYRPGPMALIPDFIKGKLQPETIKYLHPDLQPILGETYGVVVYQEQVLKIANVMAGYSLGEADILRRAMGKKSVATMNKERKKFIAQAVTKNYTEKVAEKVWSFIERFAGYGFNKAHATSYAMIAYQTAYLKANYPVEYMTSLMSAEAGREDKLMLSLEECRSMKIVVLAPAINHSNADFQLEKNDKSLNSLAIRFGLTAIKNVGSAAIDNILAERTMAGNFKSFTDFIARVDHQKVNKKVLESLIKVGSFDQFGKRSVLLDEIEAIRNKVGKSTAVDVNQNGLFDSLIEKLDLVKDQFSTDKAEFSNRELMEMERELLGIYLREHPSQALLKKARTEWMTRIINLEEKKSQKVSLVGIIKSCRIVFTKANNHEMAFVSLTDDTGEVDVVVFPKVFATAKADLIVNSVVSISGKVEEREEKLSILADSLNPVALSDSPKKHSENDIIVPRGTSKAKLLELNSLLQNNRGEDQVTLIFENGHSERELKLPYGIKYSSGLKDKISKLLAISIPD